MAVAKIYPEPEKGGRGKKLTGTGEFSEISQQRLSDARFVLNHVPGPFLVRNNRNNAAGRPFFIGRKNSARATGPVFLLWSKEIPSPASARPR